MNYRMTVRARVWEGRRRRRPPTPAALSPPAPSLQSEFKAPFRVFPMLEESSPFKVELLLKVRQREGRMGGGGVA